MNLRRGPRRPTDVTTDTDRAEQTRRAGSSRPASYEEFVHARSAMLFRTAYALTGGAADAEDLLQTVLVKLYVAWSRVRRADSVDAYARGVLVKTFVSSRRPARFARERLVTAPPEVLTGDRDPHDGLVLWPLVGRLPPRQRAVVVLRYVEDLSEAEIAAALGCARGTVKSTASAALRTLRDQLEDPT